MPMWIIIDDGETFEGHQGHFANTFFTNATRESIEEFCDGEGFKLQTREMTPQELLMYPEAIDFEKYLHMEYGNC